MLHGSVPEPPYFLLYIDDLDNELSLPCFMFADGVKIVGAGNKIKVVTDPLGFIRAGSPFNTKKSLTEFSEGITITEESGLFAVPATKRTKDFGVLMTTELKSAKWCKLVAHGAGVMACVPP